MITHFLVTQGKHSGRIMEIQNNHGTIEIRYEGNSEWGKMHYKSHGTQVTVWSQLRGKPGDVIIDQPVFTDLMSKTK